MRKLFHNYALAFYMVSAGLAVVSVIWALNCTVFQNTPSAYTMEYLTVLAPDDVNKNFLDKIKNAKGSFMLLEDGIRTRIVHESGWALDKVKLTSKKERTAMKTCAFYDRHNDKIVIFKIKYLIEE